MSNLKSAVVVVLGATGTGKSKLAIELARRFGGEVISADSMQIYKGLDIITNKVAKEELRAAPVHHMMSHVDPLMDKYTVVDYRNSALRILNRILEAKKLPVVVGGTNYYIESLLWDVLINDPKHSEDLLVQDLKTKFEELSNKELHQQLMLVDPQMAKRVHPNDRRKVLRSLQVYEQCGRSHSCILQEQQTADGGSSLGGPLRYQNAFMLWLQCQRAVLDKRLDARVHEMLDLGLLDELDNFHKDYNERRFQEGSQADYTAGIFQTIGFKEFHSFLMLPRELRDTPEGQKFLTEGIDKLKLVTRRYAKTQLKWIRGRFLGSSDRQVPPIYGLDATDLAKWDESVLQPAVEIVSSHLNGMAASSMQPLQSELGKKQQQQKEFLKRRETIECDVCQVIVKGQDQWKAHLGSKKHRSLLRRSSSATNTITDASKAEPS